MSRFEDTIVRDLNVIAGRATPSSDAWESILTRIADQEPTQETEIIMLTDNTMPTRRWPLVAAAAAVIALIVGVVAYAGTRDNEEIPTIAPTRNEDASAPDDASTPQNPATEPPSIAPSPGELTLVGTVEGSIMLAEPTADGSSSLDGTEAWSGDLTGTAHVAGSGALSETGDGLVGTSRRIVSADVDGVGEGVIILDDEWQSLFTGRTESTGTILGGTGDFAGVSGTWASSSPDSVEAPSGQRSGIGGGYRLDLVLPPVDDGTAATETLTLVGTTTGETTMHVQEEGPAVMSGTEDFTGDLVGTSILSGSVSRIFGEGRRGRGIRVLEAMTEDGRSGLIVTEDDWSWDSAGVHEGSGTVLGGTGDFLGADGTYSQSAPNPANEAADAELSSSYEFELVVPIE
jgi:hypothetical protein